MFNNENFNNKIELLRNMKSLLHFILAPWLFPKTGSLVFLNGEEIEGECIMVNLGSFTISTFPDAYFVWDAQSKGYTAGSLRISGAIAEGQTLKEAYANLKDAEQVIEETDPEMMALKVLIHRDDLTKPYAIHCETVEEASQVLEIGREAGLKWCSGESLQNNYTETAKDEGIDPVELCIDLANVKGVIWSDVYHFHKKGYTIVRAKDFINARDRKMQKLKPYH